MRLGEKVGYRGGLMVSDIPNMFNFAGYFKGTYTHRIELCAEFVLRILQHMDDAGYSSVVPRWTGRPQDIDPAPPSPRGWNGIGLGW